MRSAVDRTGWLDRDVVEQRLVDATRALVATRSFPGEEAGIAALYADMLREAGADVGLDEAVSGSPSVIGRIRGRQTDNAQTFQLAGHLDTVPAVHSAPRVRGRLVYGRGACDMKAGLAVIAEVTRVLGPVIRESRLNLLVTAYGLHEGPGAAPMHTPLRDLIRRGIVGDAVLVAEGPHESIPVSGKGALIFKLRFARAGVIEHEILHQGQIPNPLAAVHEFVSLLQRASVGWTTRHPLLGTETYFVGAIHGGDLYNRIPVEATVEGTRRYPPPRTDQQVTTEFMHIARKVQRRHGVRVHVAFERSGQPFEINPTAPLFGMLQASYEEVTRRKLTFGGQLFASDINHFVLDARVPAAAHGTNSARAHATPEFVAIDDIVRCARVVLGTGVRYVDSTSSSKSSLPR